MGERRYEAMVQRWFSMSLKGKFYWSMGVIVAAAFITIAALYGSMNGLMNQTREILDNNSTSVRFQVRMEEERKALHALASGQDPDAPEQLERAGEATARAIRVLPESPKECGIEQYQTIWAIRNSYRAYQRAREALLEKDREEEAFSEELYRVYDMQDYLVQYAGRLTQEVIRDGNQQYQQKQEQMEMAPLLLFLVAVLILLSVAGTGWKMDGLFIEPVVALSKDAERIAKNDFEGSLPVRREKDEMGELIGAFARMKDATRRYIVTLKENSELQIQLEKVQLQMLKSQVNPHFLFNTLNMISCMAQLEEAKTTDRMLLALSRLFQYTLKSSETVTSLGNEVKVAEDYLYLQEMRFGERLRYRILLEEGTEYKMVPSFLLQPLVENAIVHGVAAREQGGTVWIRSRMDGDRLWITVGDTGVGMEPEVLREVRAGKRRPGSGHGIGLGNIWKRVRIMYRDGAVKIYSKRGAGTVIRIGFTENNEEMGERDNGKGTDPDRG